MAVVIRTQESAPTVVGLAQAADFAADCPPLSVVTETSSPNKSEARHRFDRRDVAVLDPDEMGREALAGLLTDWGYKVLSAPRCETLISETLHGDLEIAVAFIDHDELKVRDGFASHTMLETALGEIVPCILTSGSSDPETLRSLERCGRPVLLKPILPDTLARAITWITGIEPQR